MNTEKRTSYIEVQMAGQFFLMSFLLLLSAPVNMHSALAINPSPLADDIAHKIMKRLSKLEGAVAVSAACQQTKSGKGEGLEAVVAQLEADLHNTKSQLQNTQTELQSQLQNTQTEIQCTRTELQNTQTELQNTRTELQNTQAKLQNTQTELQNIRTELQSQLQTTKRELQTELQSQLQNIQTELKNRTALLKMDPGSTFVRWGRKSCPANTTLIYSGVAGGKLHKERGSGTNRLCLTKSPQFDNTPVPSYNGQLYGAEYENIGNHLNHDVPCSVCRAPQSTTIMMAATLTCPPGWTAQYTGYLTTQFSNYYATNYVCLDRKPENDDSGRPKDENGLLFYHVITVCGSLPCPPYTNNKVVTCVVCSR